MYHTLHVQVLVLPNINGWVARIGRQQAPAVEIEDLADQLAVQCHHDHIAVDGRQGPVHHQEIPAKNADVF